jgi:hypothetical protein
LRVWKGMEVGAKGARVGAEHTEHTERTASTMRERGGDY